jgi:hypothetical protein
MAWNTWLTIYAAGLSTITAVVQVSNFLRDRSKLRIETWWDSNDRSDAKDRHFIVHVINDGRRTIHIAPPVLEVMQHRPGTSRIYLHSADEVSSNYNWLPLENYLPYEPIELGETSSEMYRYELNCLDKILRIQVSDRVGRVRLNRKLFWSPSHRVMFYFRHAKWIREKNRRRRLPEGSA